MKQKYLILLAFIVIISMVFIYFSSQMINAKIHDIKKLDRKIKKEQEKLNSAKVLNEQLQQVSKVILNSMTKSKSFNPEDVNMFVKKLADLADQYKIAVHSLTPKPLDSDRKNMIQHLFSLEINSTFVQFGQFLSDLESFDNIIKVKTLDVRPVTAKSKGSEELEDQETKYKITLELLVYKIVKEA
jgi:Tfp pilus assembly protein PilO